MKSRVRLSYTRYLRFTQIICGRLFVTLLVAARHERHKRTQLQLITNGPATSDPTMETELRAYTHIFAQ